MNQNANAAQVESTSAHVQGPGDRLQAARISCGLTLGDLANQMHLSESILNSLEENNFDDITAPIFVKGYLRSYARIVSLDENEIIEQYNQMYTDGDPPISSTSNAVPEINADDARVKWVTRLVVLALVGLLSLWWWNRYQQPAQPLSLDSADQMEQLAEARQDDIRIASVPAADVSSPGRTELSQQAQQELAGMSQATDSRAPSDEVIEEVEPAIEMAAVTRDDGAADLPTASQIADMAEAEVAAEAPAAEPAPATPVETSGEDLLMVVNADTWADIRDADGERLVRDLLRAGRTVELSGRAPLQVFLGNGYGVSLTYLGEAVDISGYIQPNNTARFKLGQ